MKSLARQGATVVVASAVALVGLSAPALAAPGVPVDPADAGKVVAWGIAGSQAVTIPAELADKKILAVDAGADYNLALDGTGAVTPWGSGTALPVALFPEEGLTDVKAVAAANENALALKRDGSVVAWGAETTGINAVPTDLGVAKAVNVNALAGMAVLSDGTVKQWGAMAAFVPLPDGLTDVVDVASGTLHSIALKSDGTVVAWGMLPGVPEITVPSEIQGHVKAIAAGRNGSAAVTDTGDVVVWGAEPLGAAPAELAEEEAVDIDMDSTVVVRTASGKVYAWGNPEDPDAPAMTDVPDELSGEKVTAVAAGVKHTVAIAAGLNATTKPTITGTPKVGQTLTAATAEFSLEPDSIATQWNAGGAPIAGATSSTLALTAAQVGKKITVTQTATKGSDKATVTSDPTAAVVAAQVASSVRATAPTIRYGATPRITVTVSPTNAAGRVDVYKGAARLGSTNAVNGRATVVLSRTALKPGKHVLSVRYAGNAATKASSTSVRLVVAKASAKVSASVATKKVVVKKTRAKVRVTVRAAGVVPTGTVAIYQGKRKVGTAKLRSNGTAVVKLKKFSKAGKVKLTVRYLGSSTVDRASKSIKVKVKKR
ncbi:Ig-like domain repeat protein [Mumia zhuanghuii]|uniref:Bacterial Ig-like domain-containing protein n=1 Tax=Mumia zhuanghuii TaxID=2585211 RepID=A0A5C4MI15_9ACTN|nr:Ig-like domain repeat protein [Mumia zhuanghuii]TNC36551.1 hypothetical protein FHE65_25930 [Mumia zhuanghuii]TNC42500.1 hypothetical protein FHE65_20975 [Mumia zhuanghuii]